MVLNLTGEHSNFFGTKLFFLWISLVLSFTQILSATFLVINASFLLLQKKLLNQTADTPFPPHDDTLALANDMGSFYIEKKSDLRVSLNATEIALRREDMDSLSNLVLKAPAKCCLLDPVPTNILKDCLDELLPIFSTTINLSLESGFFPHIWKESVVTPLLKKNKVLSWFLKPLDQSAIFPLFQNWLKEWQLIRFSPT